MRAGVVRAAAVAAVALAAAVCHAQAPFIATRLRVEYLDSPITVDTPTPRFSWALSHPQRGQAQSAYRIIVTLNTIGPVTPIWDSGVVPSSQTVNVLVSRVGWGGGGRGGGGGGGLMLGWWCWCWGGTSVCAAFGALEAARRGVLDGRSVEGR
jgi:hypothetical protein